MSFREHGQPYSVKDAFSLHRSSKLFCCNSQNEFSLVKCELIKLLMYFCNDLAEKTLSSQEVWRAHMRKLLIAKCWRKTFQIPFSPKN